MHAVGSPTTREALAGLGLDRFEGYVWSRAANLGEPAPPVVVASFGVFEPGLLTAAYSRARASCARETLLDTRESATLRSLHATLPEADVEGAVRVLRRGLAAARGEGRPMFAGLASLSWPEDALGQLWRACELLREHRGDTHLRLCLAAELHPVEMNLLTELWHGMPLGLYTRTRGWSEEAVAEAQQRLTERGLLRHGRLVEAGRAVRTAIEDRTNCAEQELVTAMGTDLEALIAALAGWSARCVAAGTFTTDAGKRAAG